MLFVNKGLASVHLVCLFGLHVSVFFCLLGLTVAQSSEAATCTCDLTQNACDVNCCCDQECTTADKNVFTFCKNVDLNQDDRVCVSDQIIEISNVNYRTSGTGNGLFCIYTDNYEARNFYTTVQTATTLSRFNELLQSYSKTSFYPVPLKTQEYLPTSAYKYGDALHLLFESNVQGFLAFPKSSVGSSQCDDQNPAGFLKDETSKCSIYINDLASQCTTDRALDATSYYKHFKFVPGPWFFATSIIYEQVNITVSASVARATVIPTPSLQPASSSLSASASATPSPTSTGTNTTTRTSTIYTLRSYSDPSLVSPSLVQPVVCRSLTGVQGSCSYIEPPAPSYNFSRGVCENVLKKASYTVFYSENSTSLNISSINVDLVIADVASSSSYFDQEFTIKFQKVGSAAAFTRSGNPGYITGLAVMAGTLQVDAQLKKEVIILNSDSTQWLTVLNPSSATSDVCGASSQRIPLKFGINLRTGCFISIKRSMTTAACTLLQNQIYSSLLGTFPTHVAMYGNSAVTNTADWVKILNTRPQAVPIAENGKCRNMVLGAHFEILYSKTGYFGNPQSRIVGFNVKYDSARELTFLCTGRYCQPGSSSLQTQKKEVSQSVSFVDVSTTPEAQMKPKPTFEAKAPYEFFYPFV